MTISPSYVGEPDGNGVMERFIRTLKEHRFDTQEEARERFAAFIRNSCLIAAPPEARRNDWRDGYGR